MEGSLLPAPSPWHSPRPKEEDRREEPMDSILKFKTQTPKVTDLLSAPNIPTSHVWWLLSHTDTSFLLLSFRLQRTQTYPFPDKPIKVPNEAPRELCFLLYCSSSHSNTIYGAFTMCHIVCQALETQ